jgi:hypothetical protein
MKTWWARVGETGCYGRWVPTGCSDKGDARFYMSTVYRETLIIEWLQL